MAPTPPRPLISSRTALVITLAVLCGIVTAALAFLAAGNIPGAALVGLATLGSSISFLHKHID